MNAYENYFINSINNPINNRLKNPSNSITHRKIHFPLLLIMSFLIFCLLPNAKQELIEPLNIFLERKLFFQENLNNFTSKVEILSQDLKGNDTAINLSLDPASQKKCIAKKPLKAFEEVMSIDFENTINLFDDFPLKKIFLNLLNQESLVPSSARNITNHLLLSLRLMFDLKANFKETYILLKKYDEAEFQVMKNYLINRPKFIHKYIQLLPLSDYYGQMSWSLEDIEEYRVSGILPVIRDKISKIYKELVSEIQLEKDSIYLYNVTSSWLNEQNLNHFTSLYGYVVSKSFKFDLNALENLDAKNQNELLISRINNEINKSIQTNGGGLIIIPFIDQCRHYQPGEFGVIDINKRGESDNTEKFKLRKILFDFDNTKNKIVIKTNSDFKANEEFLFSYTDFLTNDNLLLNYGIVVRNNLFQEFLFKFDMEDPGYKFYNLLKASKFDISLLNISDEYKLSIQFSLKKDVFSKTLFDFISVYSKNYIDNNYNDDNDNYKRKPNDIKSKSNKKSFDKQMDKSIQMLLRSLILYESTVDRNVNSMLDSLKSEKASEAQRKIDHVFFFEKIIEEKNKILKINNIINTNILGINKEKGTDILVHDDVQNLFYYKALHDNKKSLLLKIFNFENLKILYSQKNIVNKEIVSLLNSNLKTLKNKYVS